MRNRVFAMLLALVLCLCMAIPAIAAEEALPRVVDQADLLSKSEEAALLKQLDEISQRQKLDVVVVTADTLDGATPRDYADDFYDYNGYANDGILLLVSMEDRDWWISTKGYGITAFTDAGIEYISEKFLTDLSDGEYADAFDIFAEQCDAFITQARSGDPYDSHNLPKEPFDVGFNLIVSLAIGLLIATVYTSILKGQLKSVHSQKEAANYVRQGSMNVTTSRELFLYSEVDRTAKPKESSGSSTHRSSSGSTHGGGGGKF